MGFYDYKSRRQFSRGPQSFNHLYYDTSMYHNYMRGAEYPITSRRSRTTIKPAPPPPRTNFLKSLEVSSINSGLAIVVEFIPADNFGDSWFSVYNNGLFVEAVYAAEGEVSQTIIDSNEGKNIIAVLWNGASQVKKQGNVIDATMITGNKTSVSWEWPFEIIGNPDSELTDWNLNGLKLSNTGPGKLSTRRIINIDIVVDGSDVTLTGLVDSNAVFSGTTTLGNTCLLSQENNSGLYGSVEVGALTETEVEILALRLPKKMEIYRGLTASPTTLITSINYDDKDFTAWQEPIALTGGTYYYRLKAISDTDDDGDWGLDSVIELPTTPEPPTNLSYLSGDYSNTVLSFTASETDGVTYNLYMLAIGEELFSDIHPVATTTSLSSSSSSSGFLTIEVPEIIGYPGTVTFILRAELDGIEEKNSEQLKVEYDSSGDYVPQRPNNLNLGKIEIVDGTTLNVTGYYSATKEKGVAVEAQLFVRDPDDSYNYDIPADTSVFSGSNNQYLLTTTLSNGWHYITALAATSAGTQSLKPAAEQLVYISDENISSPTPTLSISGG